MQKVKTVTAIRCECCGDSYILTPNIIGYTSGDVWNYAKLLSDFVINPKQCLACGGYYLPKNTMFDTWQFAFDGYNRTKGERKL